jgi:hypothetical protein
LNPVLKVSGNTIVVAWEDKTPGNFDIFVRVSTNGGPTFNTPTGGPDISDDGGTESLRPHIAISGTNIVVVWDEAKSVIKAAISNDSGANFGVPITIPESTASGDSQNAQVAISGSNIIIVWEDKAGNSGEFDIFAKVLTLNGVPVAFHNLSNNSSLSSQAKIAVTGNNVIVVWQDRGDVGIDLFVRTSTNNGVTFGGPINISTNTTITTDQDSVQVIVAVAGNVYVVWDGVRAPLGDEDIFYNKSHDGGLTWFFNPPNQPLNLSEILPGTGTSQQQDISAS